MIIVRPHLLSPSPNNKFQIYLCNVVSKKERKIFFFLSLKLNFFFFLKRVWIFLNVHCWLSCNGFNIFLLSNGVTWLNSECKFDWYNHHKIMYLIHNVNDKNFAWSWCVTFDMMQISLNWFCYSETYDKNRF